MLVNIKDQEEVAEDFQKDSIVFGPPSLRFFKEKCYQNL